MIKFIISMISIQRVILAVSTFLISVDWLDISIGDDETVVNFGMIFIIGYLMVYHPYFIFPVILESMRTCGHDVFDEAMYIIWGKF